MFLGDSANFPVDLGAYGYMLVEHAHWRMSFPGTSEDDVIVIILKMRGTPMPPHPFKSLWRSPMLTTHHHS